MLWAKNSDIYLLVVVCFNFADYTPSGHQQNMPLKPTWTWIQVVLWTLFCIFSLLSERNISTLLFHKLYNFFLIWDSSKEGGLLLLQLHLTYFKIKYKNLPRKGLIIVMTATNFNKEYIPLLLCLSSEVSICIGRYLKYGSWRDMD